MNQLELFAPERDGFVGMLAERSMGIELLCADSLKLDLTSFDYDVVITDPPYSEHVHSNAVSCSSGRGTRKRDLGFESLTVAARRFVGAAAARASRWSVIYSDVESANWLAIAAQAAGAEYIRIIPWVRWSSPQLSGDRPPQGHEVLVCLHSADYLQASGKFRKAPKPVAKHWSGPGNLTHFSELCLRGEGKHKAEKPLDQALRLVSWFSEPGEVVFDPFMGRGTIGLACRILERRYVGLEIDPEEHAKAKARVKASSLSARDSERLRRFVEADDEPIAQPESGPPHVRAAMRAADKSRAKDWLVK